MMVRKIYCYIDENGQDTGGRDETNALTRLADAIAGFVRDAVDGKSEEIKIIFKKAKQEGMLIEVS